MYIYIDICIYIYMYTYIYRCICIHTHKDMHTYMHTHMHTYTFAITWHDAFYIRKVFVYSEIVCVCMCVYERRHVLCTMACCEMSRD